MPSKKIITPVEPGLIYHIYNRGNNHQKVFFRKEDYYLFLDKINKYLIDYCSIYAYALLPNHYHLLLRINEENEMRSFSQQYAKYIISYTYKVNQKYNRNGNLFLRCFRRIKINKEEYLRRLVFYIHYNPLKHEVVDDFRNYEFSSYKAFLSDNPSNINKKEVFSWFGSMDDFIEYHEYLQYENFIKRLTFEEED